MTRIFAFDNLFYIAALALLLMAIITWFLFRKIRITRRHRAILREPGFDARSMRITRDLGAPVGGYLALSLFSCLVAASITLDPAFKLLFPRWFAILFVVAAALLAILSGAHGRADRESGL